MRALTRWLSGTAGPHSFPYAAVLDEFHRVGKHFVEKGLLTLLDEARATVPSRACASDDPSTRLLTDFLDVALDKWDNRYDYRSYLALRLLRLPSAPDEPPPAADTAAERRAARDRLLVRLIADTLDFELAAAANDTGLLPQQRPAPALVTKRCRLSIRAAAPALARLGLAEAVGAGAPATAGLCSVARDLTQLGDPPLWLSMLPVHVTHDEYLFIRVLQGYECLFTGVADELQAAVTTLTGDTPASAADQLGYAGDLLRTASPLFALLATMQPGSFRTFRQYTEGASAIQSRSYKLVESLCRTPERDRLDSVAYRSVPEVRSRIRGGQPTVDETYRRAVSEGRLTGADGARVARQMAAFAATLAQWRRTHFRLAVRMLGSRSGTGYTEGTPYLAATCAVPVFTAVTSDAPSAGQSERHRA